jgi:hypothetical protein
MAEEEKTQTPEAAPEPELLSGEGVLPTESFVPIRKSQRIADKRTYPRFYRKKADGDRNSRTSSSRFIVSRKWVSTRGTKRKGSV